jgi:hypothetical protein
VTERRAVLIALGIAFVTGIAAAAPPPWTGPIDTTRWRLASPAGTRRWLEIHDPAGAKATGVYHAQVLERFHGQRRWQFRTLAGHMALTEAALRASIRGVANERAVYPETFDAAYRTWQRAQAEGRATVCESSVETCLAAVPRP